MVAASTNTELRRQKPPCGRRDASEIIFGVRRHVTSFQSADMSATPKLGQRASRRNASRRLTLPFLPVRGSKKL